MTPTDVIHAYHAHIYYDADTIDTAREVIDAACARFDVERGRMHEWPVGPHPMWSCQLACAPEIFAELLPWLVLNRRGLIVFAHPETGDPLADHAERAIWLGESRPLDINVIRRAVEQARI
jgi:DOPA 4,5-dioxygenase